MKAMSKPPYFKVNHPMTEAAPIRVQSLDHVTIVVKDLAATRRFYVEALGMDEVARPNFSFAGQWFQAGATLIHTILEFEGSGPAGLGGGANTRGHHFAFLVEDRGSRHPLRLAPEAASRRCRPTLPARSRWTPRRTVLGRERPVSLKSAPLPSRCPQSGKYLIRRPARLVCPTPTRSVNEGEVDRRPRSHFGLVSTGTAGRHDPCEP